MHAQLHFTTSSGSSLTAFASAVCWHLWLTSTATPVSRPPVALAHLCSCFHPWAVSCVAGLVRNLRLRPPVHFGLAGRAQLRCRQGLAEVRARETFLFVNQLEGGLAGGIYLPLVNQSPHDAGIRVTWLLPMCAASPAGTDAVGSASHCWLLVQCVNCCC